MKKLAKILIIAVVCIGIGILFAISTFKKMNASLEAVNPAPTAVTERTSDKPSKKANPTETPENNSDEIEALRKRNTELSNRVSELEAQITSKNNGSSENESEFLAILFYKDKNGYTYENTNDDITFYRDQFCSQPASEELTFETNAIYEVELENGNEAYCAMSKEEGIVWSTRRPYLSKIKESE